MRHTGRTLGFSNLKRVSFSCSGWSLVYICILLELNTSYNWTYTLERKLMLWCYFSRLNSPSDQISYTTLSKIMRLGKTKVLPPSTQDSRQITCPILPPSEKIDSVWIYSGSQVHRCNFWKFCVSVWETGENGYNYYPGWLNKSMVFLRGWRAVWHMCCRMKRLSALLDQHSISNNNSWAHDEMSEKNR